MAGEGGGGGGWPLSAPRGACQQRGLAVKTLTDEDAAAGLSPGGAARVLILHRRIMPILYLVSQTSNRRQSGCQREREGAPDTLSLPSYSVAVPLPGFPGALSCSTWLTGAPTVPYEAGTGTLTASLSQDDALAPHHAVRNIGGRVECWEGGAGLGARLTQGPGTDYRARGYCSCNLCHPLHQHRQVNEITGNASDASAKQGSAASCSAKTAPHDSPNDGGRGAGGRRLPLARRRSHALQQTLARKKKLGWDNCGFCSKMSVSEASLARQHHGAATTHTHTSPHTLD